ncbi:phospholipase [Stenotrophomonas pictorum JCM 9942]|uniref:Phospholipase n=1 Tax=Stenotrophomonas pictorum JCM 9942 TaxID=1236960 RepID=A0A0R0A3F0_9GAMM|nr:XVIPCD domain-containing protein [Stenotrophomonas pictorum]KRG39702.1 phospholipase [Stenotrophomonas pictorum JCM 9942]
MESTTFTKFDARSIAGTTPQSIDLQLPQVLQDIYAHARTRREGQSPESVLLPPGWTRISEQELRSKNIGTSLLHNDRSGFDAGFYRGPDGQVVLAFCGTDQGKDWPQNLGQGVGFQTRQYKNAIELTERALAAYGENLLLTGHSLGGGLAAAAGVINNTPTVTYNSAGVHSNTFERVRLDPIAAREYAADGLIRSYSVKNELLTHLQEDSIPLKWALPDAIGHRIELPDPAPLSFGQRLVPGAMLKHRYDLHGIASVMDSLDLQQLRDAEQGEAIKAPASANSVGNRLFEDAVIQLGPQREKLGLKDDVSFLNTAAGIAARSADDGLDRIDHLLIHGDRLFAVQGNLLDPAHRRSNVDLAAAGDMPMQASIRQLQQHQRLIPADSIIEPDPGRRHLAMG